MFLDPKNFSASKQARSKRLDDTEKNANHGLICKAFEWIEENEYEEHIINQSLAGLQQSLAQQTPAAYDITMLINNLSQLDLHFQNNPCQAFNDLLQFTLNKMQERLSIDNGPFNYARIAIIFSALPKLPINIAEQEKLIKSLMSRVKALKDSDENELWCHAHIAAGMAKIGIKFDKHIDLINVFIEKFFSQRDSFNKISINVIAEMWQFAVYCKLRKIQHSDLDNLISALESRMAVYQNKPPRKEPEISNSQNKTFELVSSLLKDEYSAQLKQEFFVGLYKLDIVLESVKLNLEFDGPFHYRGYDLRRVDKFRDFLLLNYQQWDVKRIPHFEYSEITTSKAKRDYLLFKLAKYPQILNFNAKLRLKELYDAIPVSVSDTSNEQNAPRNRP